MVTVALSVMHKVAPPETIIHVQNETKNGVKEEVESQKGLDIIDQLDCPKGTDD